MSTPRDFFTVSRALQMTGLPVDTLDMLHRELGDLLEVRCTSGGSRLFTPKDIANLKEIKRLLDDEGRDLEEVREAVFPGSRPVLAGTLPGAGPVQVTVSDITAFDVVQNARDDDPATTQSSSRPRSTRTLAANDVAHDLGSAVNLDDEAGQASTAREDDPDPSDGQDASSSFVRVTVQPGNSPPLAVEVRAVDERCDDNALESLDDAADEPFRTADTSEPRDAPSALTDDVDPEEITVPPLPVGPTVDLLLEATEGLVQENLKLRKAVDTLAERCLQVEERLAETRPRRGLFGLFRR